MLFLSSNIFCRDTHSCHLLLKRSLQTSLLVFTFSFSSLFVYLLFLLLSSPSQVVVQPGANPLPKTVAFQAIKLLKAFLSGTKSNVRPGPADCWKIRKQSLNLNPNLKDFALRLLRPVCSGRPVDMLARRQRKKKKVRNGSEAANWRRLWEFWETLAGKGRIPAGSSSGSRRAPQWKMLSVFTSLTSTYYSCAAAHN